MTGPAPDGRTTEELLGEVIALLAEAYADSWARDSDARGVAQPSRLDWRLRHAEPMRAVAMELARCVEVRDGAGVDRLLSGHRTEPEWRRLALILASAADPERLARPAPKDQPAAA